MILEDYKGLTNCGGLLMTIIYPNFEPMGNSLAKRLKISNLKCRKILQYHHNVRTEESHQTT